jgi:hypothetical protein
MGFKRRIISSGIVNCTRNKGNSDGHSVWNREKEYPKPVIELLWLEEKRFVQGVCYFINKISKFKMVIS